MTAPWEVPVVPLEPEGDYASPREVEPVRASGSAPSAEVEIINIRVPRDLHDRLKAVAAENERTVAAEVRMAIKGWLNGDA